MIQMLPLPRQLPRAAVWSIYSVTWLGLIVSVVVVVWLYDEDRQPPKQLQNQNGSRKDEEPLDSHRNIKLDNNNSSATKKQQSQPRAGFVRLEEIVAYECLFQPIYQNTTWLEGSDTEISYLDESGRPRLMNVQDPSGRYEDLSWAASRRDVARVQSSRCVDVMRSCRGVEECRLSQAPNICTTKPPKLHPKHGIISTRDRCPWTCEFTFIPHSGRRRLRRDVDLHRANVLPRRRGEWKEPSRRVHVTKMILKSAGGDAMYFVAAPISNVSLRFAYDDGGRCLTCPGGHDARLECPYVGDVAFSRDAGYYILYCRGSSVPWTAVVSTSHNKLVHRLDNQERSRVWYASRPRPATRELEVDLDDHQHSARVRLHLPPNYEDKTCNEKLRLILRIADEQHAQMVTAQFDFSFTNYLTTAKGYAVLYADVRASLFQSSDFSQLRFRRRELMQMSDYAKVVIHVLKHFDCMEDKAIGVFGENYGGHMALNLVADNDEGKNTSGDDKFRCCVAVNPLAKWQDYVYPFTAEHSSGVLGAVRKKIFKRRHMAPMVNRLRGKNFALHTSSHSMHQHRYYTQTLLKMLNRYKVEFEHQHYEDESVNMCDSRLKMYERASDFFDGCFGREIDVN